MGVMQSGYVFRSLTHTLAFSYSPAGGPAVPARSPREAVQGRPGRGGHRGRGGEAVVPVYRDGDARYGQEDRGAPSPPPGLPPPSSRRQGGRLGGLRG